MICPDTIGFAAAASGFLAKHGRLINESSHFSDTAARGESAAGHFYMRTVHHRCGRLENLEVEFRAVSERFG